MSKITVTCQACGSTFQKYRCKIKNSKYHFCSHECISTKCIPTECQECHTIFLASGHNHTQAKYCSGSCRRASKRRQQVHKKGKLITNICERCGSNYRVRPSVARVQRYCSQQCSGASIGATRTGKNNPRWKPKITIRCAYCDVPFEIYPSRLGRSKYCCKEHRILGNLKRLSKNPRTNIEISMADALTEAKLEYTQQALMFNKFLVDFKLTDHPIVVQCDGLYWHDRPPTKKRDRGQDAYMAKAGYVVLRFSDAQILSNVASCISQIKKTICTMQLPLLHY